MEMENLKSYAPVVVRISIALVFLWFGLNQVFDSESWLGYLPEFATNLPIAPLTLILFNGIFEVVFGLLLLLGFFTRISAALLGLHLLSIAFSLGYNDVAIRDLGLFFACVSIFLHGPDFMCLSKKE